MGNKLHLKPTQNICKTRCLRPNRIGTPYAPEFVEQSLVSDAVEGLGEATRTSLLLTTQRAHDVYTTSSQRRCNVMTLHRR